MKQLLMAVMIIITSFVANAQDTTKKIKTPKKPQRAHLDYFLKIDEVKGESPDTLPPVPSLFSINAGGTMSQTINSNLAERYSAQYTQGFTVGIGYAKEFRKSRLQINAGYQKGGVSIAVGDVNGDGKGDVSNLDLKLYHRSSLIIHHIVCIAYP